MRDGPESLDARVELQEIAAERAPVRAQRPWWIAIALAIIAVAGVMIWKRPVAPRSTSASPKLTQLTFAEGVEEFPAWSPDGKSIVYSGDVAGIRKLFIKRLGSNETQPGGRALKFYASQRLDLRRIETLKDGVEAVGNRVRVKVVKNKVAAPFRQAEFDIEFGKGISSSGCLLDLGLEHNIISKSGSFFSYGNDRFGQGRPNAKAHLDANTTVAKEIEEKIYAALGLSKDAVTPIDRDGDARPPLASEPGAPAAARAA